jgi:predicted amidohydrolase YtcJ
MNFAEKGLTSIHGILHLGKGGEAGDLKIDDITFIKSVQDKILQNCYFMVYALKPSELNKIKGPPLDEEKGDSKFKVGGYKIFLDGTFGSATACMWEAFSDQPDKIGFLMEEEEKIYEKMKNAHDLGYQIAIHVIGDKGARICVDLYKKLLSESPREDHRHRMEHASMLTSDVLKDMKELGIIASCQPLFITDEQDWLEKRLGKERCKYTYPMKSIIDAGIILASSSDCPVEDPDVILGLHALVTRNGFVPEECISMMEALKSYTINGAYAAFQEDVKGSIEKGKLADLVVLSENPLKVSNEDIKNIKVVKTIIRGKVVYNRSQN